MLPFSRPKLSDFYTLSQTKLLENHTIHSGTYLYSSCMGVPPRGQMFAIVVSQLATHPLEIIILKSPASEGRVQLIGSF